MVNEATGFPPNVLRFAVPLRGILDLHALPIQSTSSESAEILAENLKNARDDARDSIALAQRKYKKYYDSSRSPKEFNVGDLVLLKYRCFGPGYKPPAEHKLTPIASPLRIAEKLSPLLYRVDLPRGSRMHDIISIVHLRWH